MKKQFILLLLLGITFIAKPVFADSWTDEGNYNPNWQSKCINMCNFTDEKDLAGVFQKLETNPNYSFSYEVSFSTSDLDFSIHDIPTSVFSRFSMRMAGSSCHFKVKYGQMFPLSNLHAHTIEYVYQTYVDSYSHGTVTILENPTGETGDKLKVQVVPDEGYSSVVWYRTSSNSVSFFEATDLGNNIYEIPYPSVAGQNYDIYLSVRFSPITLSIIQNLDLGITCRNCYSASYGSHKVIEYRVFDDFEVTSVTVNGEVSALTNNRLEFDVYDTVTIEIHTLKRQRDSIKKDGELQFNFYVNKTDTHFNYLPGVVFQLSNIDRSFSVISHNKEVLGDLGPESRYSLSYPKSLDPLESSLKRKSGNPSVSSGYLDVYQLFPSEYKQKLDSIVTYGDFVSLLKSDLIIIREDAFEITDNYMVQGYIIIPMLLEETVAPLGYSKKNFIAYAAIRTEFEFYVPLHQELSNDSPLVDTYLSLESDFLFYPYSEELLERPSLEVYHQVEPYYSCFHFGENSTATNTMSYVGAASGRCEVPIVNEYGTPQLSIQNYVNQKNSVVVSRNEILHYQIVVENIGNASSTNNVIITKLPKEIEYVEGSASDEGVYDSSRHTITWHMDLLAEAEEYTFTYQGKIKENAKAGTQFIGISEISSEEVNTVNSSETVVQIQMINPTTFRSMIMVFLIILFTFGLTSIYFYQKRSA